MKIIFYFVSIFLFVISSNAQSQKISEAEYDKVFDFAVTETNADYPLIFKVTTSYIEDGKIVRTEISVNENELPGYSREKRTTIADGRETNKYQINLGFGKVYCSDDGVKWTPPSEYECRRTMSLYAPRDAESNEYSVTEKELDGKKVKIYRKYSVFAPLASRTKKDFKEEISTIDSRGYFITVVANEGTLDPRIVTLKREQSWTTKASIKLVVAPTNPK